MKLFLTAAAMTALFATSSFAQTATGTTNAGPATGAVKTDQNGNMSATGDANMNGMAMKPMKKSHKTAADAAASTTTPPTSATATTPAGNASVPGGMNH
ncbi:MAG TPA: hypothetical protein VGM26_08445 [Rhizomicrobium sp.]|jgi:hypothetical protein